MPETKEAENILGRLIRAHEGCFDIERPFSAGALEFDAMAQYHAQANRYVLMKRASIWEVSAHEYGLFKTLDCLDGGSLARITDTVRRSFIAPLDIPKNHMVTYVDVLLIACHCSLETRRQLQRIRYRKNLALGLKGWVDLSVALAVLED